MERLKVIPLALAFLYFIKLMMVAPVFADAIILTVLLGTHVYLLHKDKKEDIAALEAKIKENAEEIKLFNERIEKINTKLAGFSISQTLRK